MKKELTAEELEQAQTVIEESIYDYAEKAGLSNDKIQPITDGIYSAKLYLESPIKVMWVLKEPYDDNDENGDPKGGGWSIPKDCFGSEDALKNKTWQQIIYTMYGLFNKLSWKQMEYIRDNKAMGEVLKQIAYINISKMPAQTNSSEAPICSYYKKWKQILWKQIDLYKPDVIVFGYTFEYFRNDFFNSENAIPLKKYEIEDIDYLDVYKKDKLLLLDTYHPNAHQRGFRQENYVTSIISAINEFIK